MVRAAFKRLPLVSMKLVVCVNPSSTGLSSTCGSGCIVLFKIPDRFICVTLSLSGSTSMLSPSSRLVSDLDGCDVIVGVCKTIGRWFLSTWLESSYKKSVFSGVDMVSVGVDVLTIGGGVFFRFCRVVWVKLLNLDSYLVIGGDVRVVLYLEWLCILLPYRFSFCYSGFV